MIKRSKGFKKTRKPTDKESLNKMRDFFLSIWSKRRHYSEVSGTYLGSEPLSVYFHHILLKERHQEAKFDEENIILLSFDEHQNCHSDMYRYSEVNRRRELLKIKYEI